MFNHKGHKGLQSPQSKRSFVSLVVKLRRTDKVMTNAVVLFPADI